MRIGIVGTGSVGRTLAAGLAAIGHDVVVGTRDPGETRTRPEWSAGELSLVPFADATSGADLVINATGGSAAMAALEAVNGDDRLSGLVLIDVSNPLDFSHGFPPNLFVKDTDSLAEQIQRRFPDARVVKCFNMMTAAVMVSPKALSAETSILLAGNDPSARGTVADLLRQLGWTDIIDLGDLTGARGMEMWLPLWLRLYGTLGSPNFNLKIVR